MEASIYLIMSIAIFSSAVFLLNYHKYGTDEGLDNSELHARNRYSIAEKIRQEFEDQTRHHL
jgi:hypothetical protein